MNLVPIDSHWSLTQKYIINFVISKRFSPGAGWGTRYVAEKRLPTIRFLGTFNLTICLPKKNSR